MRCKLGQIRPLRDLVLVQVEKAVEQVTEAGIVLPVLEQSSSREEAEVGRVTAIGPDQKQLSVGDKVLIRDHHGSVLEAGVLILSPEQILAKIAEVQ